MSLDIWRGDQFTLPGSKSPVFVRCLSLSSAHANVLVLTSVGTRDGKTVLLRLDVVVVVRLGYRTLVCLHSDVLVVCLGGGLVLLVPKKREVARAVCGWLLRVAGLLCTAVGVLGGSCGSCCRGHVVSLGGGWYRRRGSRLVLRCLQHPREHFKKCERARTEMAEDDNMPGMKLEQDKQCDGLETDVCLHFGI